MEKQTSVLIMTMLISLSVIACTSQQQTGGKSIQDVQTGTSGLEMEFLKNAPPKIVYAQTEFPVILKIKNAGMYTIDDKKKAILSLGAERDYTSSVKVETGGRISGTDNEAEFTLDGKTPLNPRGDEEVIAYTLKASKIDPQSESHPSSVIASLCYPYQTKLAASVCIDPDPNNVRPIKKSCAVQDLSLSAGQGAPVAITKVEVQILPTSSDKVKPQFIISVENKGKGEVTKVDSYSSACRKTSDSKKITYKDFNALGMKATLSGQELKCSVRAETVSDGSTSDGSNKEFARLSSKKGVVRCTYPEDAADSISKGVESYTAPFTITLDYGYA
ncbi:MAG: hypothetical protein HY518_05990, partial [Candidatus Aenigmarchaeota archaeon]|nr:hypothetical protein [Candidatus Aenigmarchaeota archaeon]